MGIIENMLIKRATKAQRQQIVDRTLAEVEGAYDVKVDPDQDILVLGSKGLYIDLEKLAAALTPTVSESEPQAS